ncbi:unnamed protein product, partial [Ectocarpus fasciculatus]
ILVFAPPLDDVAVNVHVVNRTMIRLTLSATRADWTKAEDYLGPLKIEGIDTGAGMIVFDSPVTVAVVSPSIGTHYDDVAQVCEQSSLATSVPISSTDCRVRIVAAKAFRQLLPPFVSSAVVAEADVAAAAAVATRAPPKRSELVST